MRRLLCWFGIHRAPPGVRAEWSIAFACHWCGKVQPGRFGGAK